MEYKELEMLWKQYDEKLDNLEKINKKLLKETLLQKPRKSLSWLKFGNQYGLIIIPIVLWVALCENFKVENIDWKFILGCILTFLVVLYLCAEQLRSYLILKKINLDTDSVVQSLYKVVKLKTIANNFQKYVFFYYPALFLGCILIMWRDIIPGSYSVLFFSVLFGITYCINIWGAKKYKGRINRLEKDIAELKEYVEEKCEIIVKT
jgi:hypothetical protein